MAKVLREFLNFDYDKNVIKEAIEGNKPVIVQGVLQRANALNQNKRIYGRDVLEREINNYKKVVGEGRALGQLDHVDHATIELQNVSHIVREIWWQGDDVCGKVEILDTPKGQIAKSLMKSGITLGISSRGVGGTRKTNEGYDEVDDTFMLICFDLVSEPSTHNAFLYKEGKDVNMNEVMKSFNKEDRLNRLLNNILKK